ncbi:MAG: TldD/PmbA family protein [Thermoplasmata archaeon]
MEDFASLSERIVNRALKAGAQDVVANVYANRSYQIRFAQNQPVISNQWRERAAFVGVVVDKRVVATEIEDLSNVDERVDDLVALARRSQENPLYGGLAEGPFQYSDVAVDKRIIDLDDGGDYVEAAVNAAMAEGAVETAGSFWKNDYEHFLHTSNGAVGRDHRVSVYISIRAFMAPESSGHGIACASSLSEFESEVAGRKAGQIAALAKNPKSGEPGKYDIIFDPLILSSLTYEIGRQCSAFAVLAGLSPLKDKIGESVASEAVTIIDDGSADSINRLRFDEEGVPTQRNVLIDKGVLRTYLHNTSTAKLFEQETTANAGLVEPLPHALFCQPGDYSREELFAEMKDGLWLTNTWYTRYQSYITGDFSTIPRDGIFRIKDGEIVEVWKDIRLTDNILNLWQQIDAVGRETHQLKWWYEVPRPVFAPYAVARDIEITRSAM